MKITAKSDYAILALFHLATEPSDQPVQARDISVRQQIPHRFLEQILLNLKKAGLVHSVRGARGGYQLAVPSNKITLRHAIEAVEGSIQLFDGEQGAGKKGDRHLLAGIWKEVEHKFVESLGSVTLDDIRHRKEQGRDVLMFHI